MCHSLQWDLNVAPERFPLPPTIAILNLAAAKVCVCYHDSKGKEKGTKTRLRPRDFSRGKHITSICGGMR